MIWCDSILPLCLSSDSNCADAYIGKYTTKDFLAFCETEHLYIIRTILRIQSGNTLPCADGNPFLSTDRYVGYPAGKFDVRSSRTTRLFGISARGHNKSPRIPYCMYIDDHGCRFLETHFGRGARSKTILLPWGPLRTFVSSH